MAVLFTEDIDEKEDASSFQESEKCSEKFKDEIGSCCSKEMKHDLQIGSTISFSINILQVCGNLANYEDLFCQFR